MNQTYISIKENQKTNSISSATVTLRRHAHARSYTRAACPLKSPKKTLEIKKATTQKPVGNKRWWIRLSGAKRTSIIDRRKTFRVFNSKSKFKPNELKNINSREQTPKNTVKTVKLIESKCRSCLMQNRFKSTQSLHDPSKKADRIFDRGENVRRFVSVAECASTLVTRSLFENPSNSTVKHIRHRWETTNNFRVANTQPKPEPRKVSSSPEGPHRNKDELKWWVRLSTPKSQTDINRRKTYDVNPVNKIQNVKPNAVQLPKVIKRIYEQMENEKSPFKYALKPPDVWKMPSVQGIRMNRSTQLRTELNHLKLNGWGKSKPKLAAQRLLSDKH